MTTLFAGGALFDGKGAMLDGMAMLVEDGRIARLAPKDEFDGYAGAVVDTAGATVLPGLTDCHVHLCYQGSADPVATLSKQSDADIAVIALRNAQHSLRRGITGLRDCGGKNYLEFAARDAIRKGLFVGPTIHAAGRMICMTGGHGNQHGRVADGRDEVVKAVREQIHANCDLIKIMATGGVMTPGVNPEDAHYSAEEIAAGIAESRRFGKRSASHAQGTEGILNAVRGGIDSIEHGIFMDDDCVREMIAGGIYLVPTISAIQNILRHADAGIPDYVVAKTRRVEQVHRDSLRAYYQAGGKIAMGTDAGTPFNLHGDNARELAYMVDYGMSAQDALAAACFGGADLMGDGGRGVLAEGAAADLLVVNADPLADIAMAADRANHRAVYKDGVLVE
ncbi:MAG: amidohydrolase family protein [bacterium]